MRTGRSLVVAVVVVGGYLFTVSAAAASVGLDASYGSAGLVQLASPLPLGLHPARYPLSQAVFARNGSAYVTEAVSTCESAYFAGSCRHGIRLFRYGKTGATDSSFADSGSVALPRGTELIAADAGERALVAVRTKTGGRVERLLSSGAPDRNFGRGGSAVLKGFEGLISFLAPARRGRILVGVSEGLPKAPEAPARRLTLFRLLPNGHLDRSFAKDGRGSYALALPYAETRFSIDRRGSVLILGGLCCEGFRPVYRISAKGKLDTAFDANARGALQRLNGFARAEPKALVTRPGGAVEVLGATGGVYLDPKAAQGFALRLRADGKLEDRFGERGARSLPLPIFAASPGVDGGTIAVAQVEETVTVLRLLADGAPDLAFGGNSGIQMPQPGFGVEAQQLANARVGLFDSGFRLCSEPTCVSMPYLARFIEASPSQLAGKKGGRE